MNWDVVKLLFGALFALFFLVLTVMAIVSLGHLSDYKD